jgi:2-oxo-4-hydroxy-4-carboxy--5-ureidoimidazoline (OHCU) decarboxylase
MTEIEITRTGTGSTRDEVITDMTSRRSRKRRRETNAMTREILDRILWLRLQRQLTHLAL